jgi:hypothetical protein
MVGGDAMGVRKPESLDEHKVSCKTADSSEKASWNHSKDHATAHDTESGLSG